MVFSSLPLYQLDPQNWHQQSNDQRLLVPTHHDSTLQFPPQQQLQPPPNQGGGGGSTTNSIKPNSMVDRARQAQIPLPEAGLKCPRCESTNTKFCYFNNYNLSQPRHFCKTCRRYWTRGGALRSVPVGGGSRRTTKRSKGKSSSSSNNTNNGSSSSRSTMITTSTTSGGASSCSTSLFLNPNNLPQLPFLPSSLHHLGNSSPSGIGLSLLGAGGAEMEFPLMGSFEGIGRINGMHPFENSTNTTGSFELLGGRLINNHHALQSKPLDLHHEFMIDRVASVKLEDSQGLNLAKDFTVIQQGSDNNHYNWSNYNNNNNNVWSNSDLSGFTSSSNSHLLG